MLIRDMIRRKCSTTAQIADAAECSERSIRNIYTNLRLFGSESPPLNRGGRPRSITSPMLEALCDHLTAKPGLYLEGMAVFLYDEFDLTVVFEHKKYSFLRRLDEKESRAKSK